MRGTQANIFAILESLERLPLGKIDYIIVCPEDPLKSGNRKWNTFYRYSLLS